ncbi:unnamed protein product, partial [Mesorhabditis spiculigera]
MTTAGEQTIWRELGCGAIAGIVVDFGLFPLDTLKTRLQSAQGFTAAGGFRHLYRGIGSLAIGSAPGSAIFFVTYRQAQKWGGNGVLTDIYSACLGELCACTIRVPTELVKQRMQASAGKASLPSTIRQIIQSDGLRGLYRGFGSTVAREIPFAFIQYPLWEALKRCRTKEGHRLSPLEGAACGSVAGLFTAAITTPLDVVKTQIMLNKDSTPPTVRHTMQKIYAARGVAGLFAGVVPRTFWISLGGFVFFGAYETAKYAMSWRIDF